MENDKGEALDRGANDYVTKPVGTAELVARVRAALRSRRGSGALSAMPGEKFRLEDMEIDYDRRLVTIGGTPVKLTQTEYNILAFLSEHTGKVLTYSTIISSIWGRMDDGSVKKLQVNMANIRKKLGCKPGDNRYILNELGIGYRIQDS
jgi:two-component system KDP operon response regulator KdpE